VPEASFCDRAPRDLILDRDHAFDGWTEYGRDTGLVVPELTGAENPRTTTVSANVFDTDVSKREQLLSEIDQPEIECGCGEHRGDRR